METAQGGTKHTHTHFAFAVRVSARLFRIFIVEHLARARHFFSLARAVDASSAVWKWHVFVLLNAVGLSVPRGSRENNRNASRPRVSRSLLFVPIPLRTQLPFETIANQPIRGRAFKS